MGYLFTSSYLYTKFTISPFDQTKMWHILSVLIRDRSVKWGKYKY